MKNIRDYVILFIKIIHNDYYNPKSSRFMSRAFGINKKERAKEPAIKMPPSHNIFYGFWSPMMATSDHHCLELFDAIDNVYFVAPCH